MTDENQQVATRPTDRLKKVMEQPTVKEQFRNALGDNSGQFVASLIDLYATDNYLQKCQPREVVMEALKAATLDLPINRNLGFAWVIPRYNSKRKEFVPSFQVGWKGIVQLALRTGQYRRINCGDVYEGELVEIDKLTGKIDLSGEATSDKIIGYFAYIEFLNGFSKASFWSKEQVVNHALTYNPECKKAGQLVSNWKLHFDSRAKSTVLKHLITKYGIMSVKMADVLAKDSGEDFDDGVEAEIAENANQEPLDVTPAPESEQPAPEGEENFQENDPPITEEEAKEIQAKEQAEAEQQTEKMPGF